MKTSKILLFVILSMIFAVNAYSTQQNVFTSGDEAEGYASLYLKWAPVSRWVDESLPHFFQSKYKALSYISAMMGDKRLPAKEKSEKDPYETAVAYLAEIFNPEQIKLLTQRFINDNTIGFEFEFYDSPYGGLFGFPYLIFVNMETGEAYLPDMLLADAVLAARDIVSQNLEVSYEDVHARSVLGHISFTEEGPSGYDICIGASGFRMTFYYTISDNNLRLTSLVEASTGQDLFKNAADYLRKVLGFEGFQAESWSLDNDCLMNFIFTLTDGSKVNIKGSNHYDEANVMRTRNFDAEMYDASGGYLFSNHGTIEYKYHRNGKLKSEECEYFNKDAFGNVIESGSVAHTYYRNGMQETITTQKQVFDSEYRLTQSSYYLCLYYTNGTKAKTLEIIEYYNEDGTLRERHTDEQLYSPVGTYMRQEDAVETYEYNEDGTLKKYVNEAKKFAKNPDRLISHTISTTIYEYESGRLKKEATESRFLIGRCIDDTGQTVKLRRTTTTYDYYENGALKSATQLSYTYTDEAGENAASYYNGVTTYDYYENGKIKKQSQVGSTYYASGELYQTYYNEITYSYHENGNLKQFTEEGTQYDAACGHIIYSRKETCSYNENGLLIERNYENHFYEDAFVLTDPYSEYNKWKYEYDENGALSKIDYTYFCYDDSSVLRQSSEQMATYDPDGNFIDLYGIFSDFDESGKLIAKYAEIYMDSGNSEIFAYSVAYDINNIGEVTYTHVYDKDNNEIEPLGGSGFVHPSEIIKQIGSSGVYGELKNNKPYLDQEVLDRKNIEWQILKQASDPRFDPRTPLFRESDKTFNK